MFYPERMKQVSIIVHDDYVDKLISKLHESGLLEISKELQLQEKERIQDSLQKCREYVQKTEKILEIFRNIEEIIKKEEDMEKTKVKLALSMANEILSPQLIERQKTKARTLEEILEESKQILSKIEEKVMNANSKLIKIEEEKSLLEQQKEKIKKIKLDFDISYLGESDYLIIKAGTTENLYELQKAVEDYPIEIFSKPIEKDYYSVVVIAHKEQQETITQISRSNIFNEIELLGFSGMPSEILIEIEEKKTNLEKENEETVKILKQLNDEWKEILLILHEELIIEEERKEIIVNLGKTNKTTIIIGFVESKKVNKLENLCDKISSSYCACIFREPEEKEAPIVLDNPKWARPFESIINTFSPPKYNEIECTVILAPVFVLFFGLMLGDAGYGLIIFLLSLFGYIKLGKASPTIKDMAYIGILLGISTIIFGIIMGAFFGDLIPRYFYSNPGGNISTLYGPYAIPIPLLGNFEVPYDPIKDPILMLVMSLLLGVSALTIGLMLAGAQNLKHKKFSDFAFYQLSWYLLIPSGGAFIGHSILSLWILDGIVYYVFLIMLLIGLLLLVKAYGGLFFFEITGFLGDWLSYVRILALGLATAGIAMTINIMGEVFKDMLPIFLIFLPIVIIIIGHLVNMAFQGLGAGVHSLRLQYVEFFGRFYEGGGRLFKPFKTERIYTELES